MSTSKAGRKASAVARRTQAAFPGLLEEMTLDEVRAFNPEVAVLPLGSTEPHGPHLPYGTDTYQVTQMSRMGVEKANARGARALLYPTLPITNNVNMRKFPFACRIGVRTLMTVLADVAMQCKEDGVSKMVLVNGHGGNPGAIAAALRECACRDDMPFLCLAARLEPAGYQSPLEAPGEHGDEYETSMMLSIRPDLVRMDRLANNPMSKIKVPGLHRADFVRPWHLYLPVSAGGETRKSTAAKGRTVLEAESEGLAELLVGLSQAAFDERFPYH